MLQITTPFPQFFGSDGKPLDNGSVYVGEVNQNPETYPIVVYWDADLTLPVAQPIKTINGYLARNGMISRVYTDQDTYSIVARDKARRIVYSVMDATASADLTSKLASSDGANMIGYTYDGTTIGTVKSELDKYSHKSTWVSSPDLSDGIYSYLELYSIANIELPTFGMGVFSSARSSTSGGSTSDASIGISAFAYQDDVGRHGSVWGLYSTVLRKPLTDGFTHGMEIDVGNLGNTVAIFPNAIALPGQSDGIWLCAGGETTNVDNVGIASVALAIVRNDSNPSPSAAFEKGILFHSKSIYGCNGDTGNGIAIAFAKGHQQIWFNNANQATAEICANTSSIGNAQAILFTDYGLVINNRNDNGTLFNVQQVAGSLNFVQITGAVTGDSPSIHPNGGDTNTDLILYGKGTGVIDIRNLTVEELAGASFGYAVLKINGTPFKVQLFNLE